MKTLKLNHAAIWLAIILSQVIPLGWYAIFSDHWQTFSEVLSKYVEANQSNWLFVAGLLGGVLAIYLMAWLFERLPVTTAQSGLVAGILIGAIFNMTSLNTMNLFSAQPLEMAFIDEGANILAYGIAGLVLGFWRKYEEEDTAGKKEIEPEEEESEIELAG